MAVALERLLWQDFFRGCLATILAWLSNYKAGSRIYAWLHPFVWMGSAALLPEHALTSSPQRWAAGMGSMCVTIIHQSILGRVYPSWVQLLCSEAHAYWLWLHMLTGYEGYKWSIAYTVVIVAIAHTVVVVLPALLKQTPPNTQAQAHSTVTPAGQSVLGELQQPSCDENCSRPDAGQHNNGKGMNGSTSTSGASGTGGGGRSLGQCTTGRQALVTPGVMRSTSPRGGRTSTHPSAASVATRHAPTCQCDVCMKTRSSSNNNSNSTRQQRDQGQKQSRRQQFPLYASVFPDRTVVSVKVGTHHHPVDLRPALLTSVAQAVERLERQLDNKPNRDPGPPIVLAASVRYGCILINLDTRNFPSNPSQADTLSYARQLLPTLLHKLELTDGLSHGQYLCLQLGSTVVHATQHSTTAGLLEWKFEFSPHSIRNSTPPPRLCLARPLPAETAPGIALPNANPADADAHTLEFELRVWSSSWPSWLIVGSDPGVIRAPTQGPRTALVEGADDAAESNWTLKPHMQLWVRCQGRYLPVSIQASSDDETHGRTARVAVQLPYNALARHHQPDGPIARLQLLTAELWNGDVLLSDTSVLIDVHKHLQPAPAAAKFGWWGAHHPTAASGLVYEVMNMVNDIRADATSDAMQSYEAFISDLTAWLLSMQAMAPLTCCDMHHSPAAAAQLLQHESRRAGLRLEQCMELSDGLLQHTAACSLRQTHALLRAQRRSVLDAWRSRTSLTSSATITQSGLLLAVRPCLACDALYYERLRSHLRHARMVLGGVVTCSITLISVSVRSGLGIAFRYICCTWAVMQAIGSVSTVFPPGSRMAAQVMRRLPPTAAKLLEWVLWGGGAETVSTFAHMCVEGFAFRMLVPDRFCRFISLGPAFASHSMFTLVTEKAYLWGRWPVWMVRLAVMLEMVMHMHLMWICPKFHWLMHAAYPVTVVVVPWMLDGYWRKLLMPVGRGVHGGEGGDGGVKVRRSSQAHDHAD